LTHVGVDVGERLDREAGRHPRRLPQLGSEAVVGELFHAAVRVMDQHHLARPEQAL